MGYSLQKEATPNTTRYGIGPHPLYRILTKKARGSAKGNGEK